MARRGTRGVLALVMAGGLATVTAGAAGASAPVKASGEPVKVMVIYEKSAGVANPEIPEGAIAKAKALNKRNGIQGRPVRVLSCDTTNDPNRAAECGRRAVSEGVTALIGVLTPHSGSFMPLMVENKIPSIGNVPASAADFTSPAAFPITGGAPVTFATLPRLLVDDGAKVVSIVRPDLAAGAALKSFANQGLEPVGMEVVNDVPVPIDAPDMSTYVTATLAGGTDAIVVGLPGQQAINFIQAARQADPKVKLALISTEAGPVLKALGDQTKGIIQSPSTLPLNQNVPTNKQYRREMKAAGYKELTGFREQAWLAVQILADIAADLPELTSAAVYDKLGQTSGLATGATPPLQWTQGGVAGLPRIFNGCEMGVKLTAKGVAKPMTGKFFNPFTGEDCPTP